TVVNAWWPGWTSDTLKRISMGFDAGTRDGVFAYTLALTAKWNGGATQAIGSYPGKLVIVNRKSSEFGAGWWLAGLERIRYQTDGSLLWVGGDGSHRLYLPDPATAGRWGTDPFLRPDSIVLRTDADPAKTRYARILPGRGEVRFDNQGRHRETVSPRGDTTYFAYDGEGRLDLVSWSGAGGNGYDFRYAASGAPLSSVATWGAAPGTERVVQVRTDANRRVTAIVDPTPDTVRFGYAAGSTSAVVTSRTDRMGATTSFIFDAGSKLWRSTFALVDSAATANDSINIRFTPVETRGYWPFPVPTAAATVAMNGPRTDVEDAVYTWVNRWGMPVRVRAPDASITELEYGDPRWPGAVTGVRHPNGRVVSATYDARGNLETSTDWSTQSGGRYATTLYRWDAYWDHVVQVTAPEGETTLTGLDTKGRVSWVQPGYDASRRTFFFYRPETDATAPGLPSGTKPPLSGLETYEYDGYGNLGAVVSPLGFRTTSVADRIGRDTLLIPAQGARTRTVHDAAGRVARSVTFAGSDSLVVTTSYDREGRPRFVTRATVPNTSAVGAMTIESRYDRAGRKTAELAPDFATDSMIYNPAGQVTRLLTRRYAPGRGRLEIQMQYDLMGRLTRRIVPGDTFVTRWQPEFSRNWTHPRLPLSPYLSDPNQIPADTSVFTYDVMGNLLTADNGAALVRRTWGQNGALLTETQKVFPYAGARDSTQHIYTLRHRYDLDGRRVASGLSSNLMPAGHDTIRYGYDPATGALAAVTDPYAGAFSFLYDAEGRLSREDRPGGIWEWRQYDTDGRMVLRGLNGPYAQRDSLVLDSIGRVREGWSAFWRAYATYNAFGALIDWNQTGRGTEFLQPRVDPLGNVLREQRYAIGEAQELQQAVHSFKTNFYSTRTGRLLSTEVRTDSTDSQPSHEETSQYDDAGNRTWFKSSAYFGDDNGTMQERTASYYTADGKLRVVDRQRCMTAAPIGSSQAICTHWDSNESQDPGVFEEYRYDALGRRVLVRSRPERTSNGIAGCTVEKCPASITRTVWDGDQIVAEIRADGEDGASLETDLPSGAHYGRVVYTHGGGIDAPLAFTRFNYDGNGPITVVPHPNWRGLFEGGTFEDGTITRGTLELAKLDWAGINTSAYFAEISPTQPDRWFGSLIGGMRDGSGQLYRRNRYLDPASGRFTQEDPIGLAGGLNLYAFGGGDPISYADPYGLCPKWLGGNGETQSHDDCTWRDRLNFTFNPLVRIEGVRAASGRWERIGRDIKNKAKEILTTIIINLPGPQGSPPMPPELDPRSRRPPSEIPAPPPNKELPPGPNPEPDAGPGPDPNPDSPAPAPAPPPAPTPDAAWRVRRA
ncbi:MAG TPA: RHS repeat-associated core domain-containing protein, partial [Longimicrobium sp.]|nr:RHS repeat-associated core domain-containing protein [Longimicrobium sp.]